jgi:hypothetical protein
MAATQTDRAEVAIARRIGLVQLVCATTTGQSGWRCLTGTDDIQHHLLLDIERLDDGHDQMRAAFAKRDVVAGS